MPKNGCRQMYINKMTVDKMLENKMTVDKND